MQKRVCRILIGLAVAALLVVVRETIWKPARESEAGKAGDFDRHQEVGSAFDPKLLETFHKLEKEEAERNRTIWKKEKRAQAYGKVFVRLWNRLNRASGPMQVLKDFRFERLAFREVGSRQSIGVGIEKMELSGELKEVGFEEWRRMLQGWRRQGYTLAQSEWRHAAFEEDEATGRACSTFVITLHVKRQDPRERVILQGELDVDWKKNKPPKSSTYRPSHIRVRDMTVTQRRGPRAFERVAVKEMMPQPKSDYIGPLIVQDMNGDGSLEIILAACNLVYRRQDDGHFEGSRLCQIKEGPIYTASVADFNQSGHADFLAVDHEGLLLYEGDADIRFETEPHRVWRAPRPLRHPRAITAGDVDQDGDLDVWFGQYRTPYVDGQMPTPYYDADDGYPSYLLMNEGGGRFRDATEAWGLAETRHRRVYSASLTDVNGDGAIDLVTINDFAGAELFLNRGSGRFERATSQRFGTTDGFGMAHTFADLNEDGRRDFLMIGMNSWTADRLENLGLGHPDFPDYTRMRAPMTFGNRLFLRANDGFKQAAFQRDLNHTGWAWGVAAFDVENDGDSDLCIANGHRTRASVRDYEPHFWLHDIYVGTSRTDRARDIYFRAKQSKLWGRQRASYGGYEKNRLLLNEGRLEFEEVGYLMGAALEADSRSVLSEDFDGDGRRDLLVTTSEVWPRERYRLLFYRNRLQSDNHWVGVRLIRRPARAPIVGTKVTLIPEGGPSEERYIITGESYQAQHSNTIHWGLGRRDDVKAIRIDWPDGKKKVLNAPEVDRYHLVEQDPL